MSYDQVSQALRDGAGPALLCMTCPWDRYCITPPKMTRAEVEAKLDEAHRKDELRAAGAESVKDAMPVQTLMTAMMFGAADTTAPVCPIFAMRLRLPEGRNLVDQVKAGMQAPHQ